MFDVKDSRRNRRRVVFGETQLDAECGVVLAAIDFEWTCRRAILALSKTPTTTLYEKFVDEYGAFKKLKKAWGLEVKDAGALPNLFNGDVTWDMVHDAMQCRNAVAHGTESRMEIDECRWAVCVLEEAADVLAAFVETRGKSIFKCISRRRSRKAIAEKTKGGAKLENWHERVKRRISKYPESHWIRSGLIV